MRYFAMLCTAALLALIPLTAKGHGAAEWIMNHPQYSFCCGRDDCHPVHSIGGTVIETEPGVYLVHIPTHKNAPDGATRTFRYGGPDTFDSQDAEFWVCVYANSIRCLFVAPGLG